MIKDNTQPEIAKQSKMPVFWKAVILGAFCAIAYLTTYIFKYLLSNFESILISQEAEVFTVTNIAVLSTVYMVAYASGQLINGFLGDHIKPKYMAAMGMGLACVSLGVFPLLAVKSLLWARGVSYFVLGFGLSMLRSPFTKLLSENLPPKFARVCCATMGASSAFLGSAISAYTTSLFPSWQTAYWGAAIIAGVVMVSAFVFITIFEKTRLVVNRMGKKKESKQAGELNEIAFPDAPSRKSIFGLLEVDKFVMYIGIAIVVEVSISCITNRVPTFFKDCLGYDETTAAGFITIISIIRGVTPYLTLALYALFRNNDKVMIRVFYGVTVALFGAMIFMIPNPDFNKYSVAFVCMAFLGMEIVSNLLWSMYIPSLGSTGRVSSASGFIDAIGYGGAAICNVLFAQIISADIHNVGLWQIEIGVWAALSLVGIGFSFLSKVKLKRKNS